MLTCANRWMHAAVFGFPLQQLGFCFISNGEAIMLTEVCNLCEKHCLTVLSLVVLGGT